jgi:hypothetical protein
MVLARAIAISSKAGKNIRDRGLTNAPTAAEFIAFLLLSCLSTWGNFSTSKKAKEDISRQRRFCG